MILVMRTNIRPFVAILNADETVFMLQLFSKQRQSLASWHSFESCSSRSFMHPRCTISSELLEESSKTFVKTIVQL